MGLLYVKTEDGRKKPSVWVWLTLLGILLGVSIFFVTNTRETGLDELTGSTKQAKAEKAPIPVEKTESEKAGGDMDAQTRNEMEAQIQRETEENNGFLPKNRKDQIEEKFREVANERAKANFQPSTENRLTKLNRPDPTPAPTPKKDTEKTERAGYKTLAERLGGKGGSGGGGGGGGSKGKAIDFPEPKNGADKTETKVQGPDEKAWGKEKRLKNFLPMGTFIPCVLDGDIVTSTLTSSVWANVVIDVTFRRQLQLPKGLVKIRGTTAIEPTQDVVDVVFDTMLFSDGTELPISGFAYAAFDPRYPHRFRTRGIPGEIIVPPMWIKFQSLVLAAALGASDAYIQNYIAENSNSSSTWTPISVPNGTNGTTTTWAQTQGNQVNNQIWPTIGLTAAQGALTLLVNDISKDAEKYKPYLIVDKGTPFFIQLESTVDIDSRRINGYAISKDEELKRNIELAKQGVPMPDNKQIYPPGDARAKYTGQAGTEGNTSQGQAQNQMTQSQKLLNTLGAKTGFPSSPAGATGGTGAVPGTTTPNSVQQILQNL